MCARFVSRSVATSSDEIQTWILPKILVWYIGPYFWLHS